MRRDKKYIIRTFLKEYLDLNRSKEDEEATINFIRNGVEFKGTNLWVLIFATFIASLGLNVNSTAVIIGAMLISPLMGPVMGIGLSIGINDFELMKRSLKSYLITTLFSVVTASVYFAFTPLDEVQSEMLARTSPTIYDVFIALVGGFAGIVALATKEKGYVIPGVAIATALIPPLCTAGFGLATGNLFYFLGAFYLYFINSVFISLATYIGVRLMRFQRKQFVNKDREKLVKRYLVGITVVTMCPAVFLTYSIVRETIYDAAANNFINHELVFPDSQILSRDIDYDKREIKVVLLGKEVPENQIQTVRERLQTYNLTKTKLLVFQGIDKGSRIDIGNIKSQVMEDFYKTSREQQREAEAMKQVLSEFTGSFIINEHTGKELQVLFPHVKSIAVSKTLKLLADSSRIDTVTYAVVKNEGAMVNSDKVKLIEWLKARTGSPKITLLEE